MKITCPNCATRYDVDDTRFVPDGRSVRCAECDESWFVPAPEPVEDLVPLKPRAGAASHARQRGEAQDYDEDPRAEKGPARRALRDDAYEEPVDEPLFDAAPAARRRSRFRIDAESDSEASVRDDAASDRAPSREQKGRAATAAPDEAPPRRAARDGELPPEDKPARAAGREQRSPDRDDARTASRRDQRDEAERGPRAADRTDERAEHRVGRGRADREDAERGPREHARSAMRDDAEEVPPSPRARRANEILDADFEDVGVHGDQRAYPDEGFGRRVRDERRRATALARIEDLDPVAERVFSDEFFTALRVQPRELERAIRKARRRAEAREKNRLTPLRALGWSALVGVVALGAFSAYAYRDAIVALAPNASGAYEAVGIEANPYGLKIEGVTHRVALSQDGPVIEILGRLKNETKSAVDAPMLEAQAVNADGETLARWTFTARSARVRPGESADFATRAPAPDGVSEVLLSFAPAQGVKVTVGELLRPVAQ